MKTTADYLDALTTETLSDMADSFFSRRKGLEDAIDIFNAQAEEVKAEAEKVLRVWRAFYRLLLGPEGLADFLALAGLPRAGPLAFVEDGKPCWRFTPPWALFAGGKYRNALLYCYQTLAEAVTRYREGVYAADPKNPKRKRLTPNYQSLSDLGAKLAAEIDCVNSDQPAYCLISFAKGLNPAEIARERVTGATLGNMEEKFNKDMAFEQINFEDMGVPDIPPLPAPDDVEDKLRALAGRLYKAHSAQCDALLAALAPS
jgi:hypothetical protein